VIEVKETSARVAHGGREGDSHAPRPSARHRRTYSQNRITCEAATVILVLAVIVFIVFCSSCFPEIVAFVTAATAATAAAAANAAAAAVVVVVVVVAANRAFPARMHGADAKTLPFPPRSLGSLCLQ
jgi:hypothetical protein